MLRIAVGGISHETNTYAEDSLGKTDYEDFYRFHGEAIIELAEGTRTYLGGMVAAAVELGVDLIPTFYAIAVPAGPISSEAYMALRRELLQALAKTGPVDAVVLELHGAGLAEGTPDVEGDLARAIREQIGPGVPITAALDLHGNVTGEMATYLDVMLGVELYPHTDMWERGFEAVALALRIYTGDLTPTAWVEPVPMLIAQITTDHPAVNRINEICRSYEAQSKVVDCTFFHGFAYSDSPHTGASIVVTTHNDIHLAQAIALKVATELWNGRASFQQVTLSPAEAIEAALALPGRPVLLSDIGDNPGGGSPGDGTHVLRALLEAGPIDACFGVIYDPAAVQQAVQAGPGALITVELGGHHDELHGQPIRVEASVRALTDGKFVLRRGMGAGDPQDLGLTALLTIGGVDVIVTSGRSQVFDPEVFVLHGMDVSRRKIVVIKSAHHFRAGFAGLAAGIVTADSPGLTTLDIGVFPRRHTPRPIWPLDAEADYVSSVLLQESPAV
jgi:microcystin degradation protein MlrC